MAITRTLRRQTSPRRAVAHLTQGSVTQRAARGDEIPAMLWLWLLIVGVIAIKRLPPGGIAAAPLSWPFDGREMVTIGGMVAATVIVGSFAPRFFELLLLSILIAALLADERAVIGFLDGVIDRLASLAGPAGSGGGGGNPPKSL